MNTLFKKIAPLVLVVLLSYFSLRPLLTPYYFPMHDDTQPARVQQMSQSLRDGQFPVRIVADLGYGYGYPLYNYYAPLPYYFGSLFNLFGADPITATKIMMVFAMVMAGITMFIFINSFLGFWPAIASAVLYQFAPYHAVQLYVRGAVGELWAYAFLPLLPFSVGLMIKGKLKKGFLIGSLVLGVILLSHNISGLIILYGSLGFLLVITAFPSLFSFQPKVKKYFLFVILSGVAVSAFFILPAILELKYTSTSLLTVGGSDYRNHFVTLFQLWDSPWGFGGSTKGVLDGMSFKIGKPEVIFGLFGILLILFKKGKQIISKGLVILLIVSLMLTIFLMLEESSLIWNLLPGFRYIQYPWRFLSIASLIFSLSSIFPFLVFKSKLYSFSLCLMIVGITILYNAKLFQPQYLKPAINEDYVSKTSLQNNISKISDEYLPLNLLRPAPGQSEPNKMSALVPVYVSESKIRSTIREYTIENPILQEVQMPLPYFPGWEACVDSKKVDYFVRDGRIVVALDSGTHRVKFTLHNSLVRTIGNTISLLTLFLLGYVTIVNHLKGRGIILQKKRHKFRN